MARKIGMGKITEEYCIRKRPEARKITCKEVYEMLGFDGYPANIDLTVINHSFPYF